MNHRPSAVNTAIITMPDTSATDLIDSALRLSPVIPVLVVDDVAHAAPLARALFDGGIKVLEITLRTPQALAVIEAMARAVPQAVIAAGTVTTPAQLAAARDAGAQFAVSPGLTPALADAVQQAGALPLLPGVATASELMLGLDAGLGRFKLFPAEAVGGIKLLQSLHGPFRRPCSALLAASHWKAHRAIWRCPMWPAWAAPGWRPRPPWPPASGIRSGNSPARPPRLRALDRPSSAQAGVEGRLIDSIACVNSSSTCCAVCAGSSEALISCAPSISKAISRLDNTPIDTCGSSSATP